MAKQIISVEIYPSSKGGGNVLPFDEIKKIENVDEYNNKLTEYNKENHNIIKFLNQLNKLV